MAFRLEIDDVFSISGRGTVVTGEVAGGELAVRQQVVLLTPDDVEVVRTIVTALEVRRREVTQITAGQQAGLLLRGVDRGDLRRGLVVVRADEHDAVEPVEDPEPAEELPRLGHSAEDTPLLLLPMRIETRFERGRLRIRAWPDDIHVDAFEERLTPDEAELVDQLREVEGAKREARIAAIAARIGEPRARLLKEVADSAADPETVEESWNSRPMARLLPDRLVAVAETEDGRRFATEGQPIPEDGLPVAPGPGDDGTIRPGDPMAWMADFAAAERVGMAMELALPADVDRLSRLMVLGVSRRHDGSAFGSLLRAHAHTTGLGAQPPLAPTKGSGASPWTSQRGSDPRRALAGALGVDPREVPLPDDVVDTVPLERAARRIVWEAAVRPALIVGFGLDDALVAGSDDAQLLALLEKRYVDRLRAYGPLPILRVGSQPYGVLPVTPTEALLRRGADAGLISQHEIGEAFAAAARSSRATERAEGGWLAMLRALARQPSGQSWRGRPVIPGVAVADWVARSDATSPGSTRDAIVELREALGHVGRALSAFGLPEDGLFGDSALSSRAYRLCGPLVAPGAGDPDRADQLPDRLEPNYLRELLSGDLEEDPDASSDAAEPRAVLDLLAEAAVVQVLGDVAAEGSGTDPQLPGTGERTEPDPPSRRRRLIEQAFGGSGPVAELLAAAGRGQTTRAGAARAITAALDRLAAAPPEALHAAVAVSLDMAATRVDAWVTSFATEELQTLRERAPSTLAVGAWGVVEDLTAAPDEEVQPFVLSPSMDHAATAALLHQARAGLARTAPDLLTVDLSASKVRWGRRLAGELRRGTPIEESLGVLAAESLRDQRHADALPDLAAAYPLREGVRPEDADGSATAGDSARRTARIDGLALLNGGADPDEDLDEALNTVREELRQAVGGLRDLLLAEGAHALAQGRPEAAAAALDGLGAGAPPPDRFDAVDPVRAGESLALAVALVVPTDDPPSDADLLTTLLPGVADVVDQLVGPLFGSIEVEGRAMDGAETREFVGVDELGVSALELALLSRPGQDPLAALAPRAAALAEERSGGPLADLRVESSRVLDDVLWAAARAGELLSSARPLTDDDLADPELPELTRAQPVYDVSVEQRAATALSTRRDALAAEADAVESSLAAGGSVDLGDLRVALDELRALGLSAARYRVDERTEADVIVARARDASTTLTARLDEASEVSPGERLPVLLPDTPLPGVAATVPDAWDGALELRSTSPVELAAWIEQTQQVRPRIEPLADLLLAGGDERVPLRVVQWPVRQASAANPVDWVGARMLEDDVHTGHSSLLACGLSRDTTPPDELAGLIIDQWEEVVPARRTMLGIAARAPAPPARAPQAALLAVPPAPRTSWTTEVVADLIGDTIDLAAARSVDLRELPAVGQGRNAGTPARFDGIGWLLPLLWIADHETDLHRAACPPEGEDPS